MAPSVRAALIIVSYGSADLVEANVAPLSADWPELAVIVVDCFTTAAERARVAEVCTRRGWRAVLLDENLGFGGGVGKGADAAVAAGAEVLLVLNPDAVLAASDARMLVDAASDAPDGLVAPVIRRPDGSLWTEGTDLYLDDGTMAGVRHRARHEGRPRMFWVSGACFALSAGLWQRTGGFDDAYFLYWEDVDLSRRVWELGGTVRVLTDASAVHDEGGTHEDRTAGRAKSETFYYYNIRNRLLFARLRLDAAAQQRWRRTARRASWDIVLQGGRRQLLGRGPWRAFARGLRDGRRGVTGPMSR